MSATEQLQPSFTKAELVLALVFALIVEVGIMGLLAGLDQAASLDSHVEARPKAMPISITPVLDESKLLKLGSKKKPRLPSMWRKRKPKKRYADKSAPTVDAKKEIDKLPENEMANSKESPAPEDAEDLAKEVEEDLIEESDEEVELSEDGHEDGYAEGTEMDPLKALVVNQYRLKLINWFRAGFVRPADRIDNAILCALRAASINAVSADRTFTSYTLTPSGNAVFDARVRKTLDRKVGQQLPPPPPKYSDVLTSTVSTTFSGQHPSCKTAHLKKPSVAPPEPAAPSPEPAAEQAEAPIPEASPEPVAPVPEPSAGLPLDE